MKPTDDDFKNIDLHGLVVQWKEYLPGLYEAEINLKDVRVIIERRPFYCDRGRYGFWAESKSPEQVCIDFADGFPRYFFSLQRAIDEMSDWVEFRKFNKIPDSV